MPGTFHYQAYGFTIAADEAVSGLRELDDLDQPVDLYIYFNEACPRIAARWEPHPYFNIPSSPDGRLWIEIFKCTMSRYTRLQYANGTIFTFDAEARNIWVDRPTNLSIDHVSVYLVNQVFGFVLRLSGKTCLHASAIEIDNEAVLISAPSGYGKSTFASLFLSRGHPIIVDDICAMDFRTNGVYVPPAYPRLRVWADTAKALLNESGLSEMPGARGKRYLALDNEAYTFAHQPKRMKVIYLLKGWADRPEIRPISALQALPALMDNTYLSPILTPPIRRVDFETLGHLIAQVPVRVLLGCNDLAMLDEAYAMILSDIRAL